MISGCQFQISVKLDRGIYEQLSLESGVSYKPKNRIINDAIFMYTSIARMAREYELGQLTDVDICAFMREAFEVTRRKRGGLKWR